MTILGVDLASQASHPLRGAAQQARRHQSFRLLPCLAISGVGHGYEFDMKHRFNYYGGETRPLPG